MRPLAGIEDAQAAVDVWRTDYNTSRPHQSLAMAYPAARFAPATGHALDLSIPASLAPSDDAPSVSGTASAAEPQPAAAAGHRVGLPHAGKTVEIIAQADTCQITVEDGITITAACKASRDIKRHKASDYPLRASGR